MLACASDFSAQLVRFLENGAQLRRARALYELLGCLPHDYKT
jgi:hypothetical protein